MFKSIPPGDYTITPVTINKEWTFTEASPEITVVSASRLNTLFNPATDGKTGSTYTRLLYEMIRQTFYASNGEYVKDKEYLPKIVRNITNSIRVLSIPTLIHGEGVVPGSLLIDDISEGKTYVDDGKGNIILRQTPSAANPDVIGNVFYKSGIVVLMMSLLSGEYTITLKGTHTIYEHEAICQVSEGEFNVTLNPTTRKTKLDTDENVADFAVSTAFSPYITTVGLYDKENDLIALVKLARPVRKESGLPMVFCIRFDM